MSKIITGQGEYNVKATGEKVSYEFEYPAFDSLEEMTAELGEAKIFANAQRMLKVDASNTAREKAKVENGHSTRKAMSEEEKANAKAKRAQDKALLAKINAMSQSDREALGL